MGFSAFYVVIPVIVGIFILRKYRERKWGRFRSKRILEGKVFLVTGANSGIGKETVRELARRKAKVILASSNLDATRKAIEDIRRSTNKGELIPMHLDLGRLESVRKFALEVSKSFPKIDVLINNAGVFVPIEQNKTTKDGFEINFGVNHLGHFLLTNLLLENVKAAGPGSRIVVVSSSLYEKGKIDFDNLNGEKGWQEAKSNAGYCNSKFANALFAVELNRRLQGTGVNVYTLCPGFVYTNLSRYLSLRWYSYILFLPIMFFFMRTPTQGAQTILHCAVSEECENESGLFYKDCTPWEGKKKLSPHTAVNLWEVSNKLVGL